MHHLGLGKELGIGAPKIPASFHETLRPAAFDMSRYADVEWIPDAETTKIRKQREQQLIELIRN